MTSLLDFFVFFIRNLSHIATRLIIGLVLLLVVVRRRSSKKNLGSVLSNRIGMKFGRIIREVNTHRVTERILI